MTKITVHVTKEVLEATKFCKGVKSENCAIAYCVRQIFPNAFVGGNFIQFGNSFKVDCWLPQSAQMFIWKWDATRVEDRPNLPECSFEIEIPDIALEGIDISEVHRIIQNSKTLSLA